MITLGSTGSKAINIDDHIIHDHINYVAQHFEDINEDNHYSTIDETNNFIIENDRIYKPSIWVLDGYKENFWNCNKIGKKRKNILNLY